MTFLLKKKGKAIHFHLEFILITVGLGKVELYLSYEMVEVN